MIMKTTLSAVIIAATALVSCAQKTSSKADTTKEKNNTMESMNQNPLPAVETATFANGCFWCTEAIFEELDGVISAVSGYTGGTTENPTYKQVCTGNTGHAEALE